jgi:hypothetical protein
MRNFVVTICAFLSGCSSVNEARVGAPLPPRPASCKLKFATVSPADMAPGHAFGGDGKLQNIGVIVLNWNGTGDPLAPETREAIRPRACEMGGTVVSLVSSFAYTRTGFDHNRQLSFQVWAPRKSGAMQDY